ncbi:hypothetical protein NO989_18815 [Alteromonas sp. DY56-G5]|jgi:hypothetical protein|uniref:Uncharacterized protein n=2 Tax=Alteromonas mediterranea TaxID=314275 RepID=A0AAC8XNP2_9ALTE|nr:hypothetical protein [Alteromonas mediterranea]AFV87788.1 hypothetical protein amad1_21773 [Alteromonas mediterranea DE1]AGP87830.1 hypothetical protein I607_20497 [Alteromonas mediterranea U4]AGP99811.1 hypothetical protein I635_21784 [Alteromonas mediterranea UM7]AMJ80908.1 hypothetical protein AV942_21250 [Alteromonas mediterranea]AMJ85070.1 hypothetical protein AV941_21365 [Alteromonas mediterranea]|tara:strand:+ start:5172 stop:5618 length:447 start_codon:yes stop_codon:yes gene_type:complete
MKNFKPMTKQKGYISAEWAIIGVLALGLLAYNISKSEPLAANGKEQKYNDAFTTIISQARIKAEGRTDGFATFDIEDLSSEGYISEDFGDGSGTNFDGGDWSMATSTVDQLIVSSSGLQDDICARVAEKWAVHTAATCTSGTVTVSVR